MNDDRFDSFDASVVAIMICLSAIAFAVTDSGFAAFMAFTGMAMVGSAMRWHQGVRGSLVRVINRIDWSRK